ncbi:MAG: glycosyltransferase [Fibrobacteres bacterium]|nr:glycosyltransferase [Fibrobacterota bacterium]
MAKRVLIIAFHFPPIQGSSGFLRTLKFARYLPDYGIEPTVLTVNPRAYVAVDPKPVNQLPAGVEVHRSFGLDAQKHMGIAGRYPAFLGIPDKHASWIPAAVLDGKRLIRKKRIEAIYSTYPIPSAHVIGHALAKWTGLPWVADFRDPMWDEFLEVPKPVLWARKRIEAAAIRKCTQALTTTQGIADLFYRRYPELPKEKLTVISNGFDENDFSRLPPHSGARAPGPVTLTHAGLLEQVDRDPVPFFRGIKLAIDRGGIRREQLQVNLMGTGNDAIYQKEIADLGLGDVVRLKSPVPYAQAIDIMSASDILLLFQGPSCEAQIPAKLYEYMRVGRPILALTTHEGETGRLVKETASGTVVRPEDPEPIARAVTEWVRAVQAGQALPAASAGTARGFSRQNQAQRLAGIFAGLGNAK